MPFIQGGVIPALLTPFTKGGKHVDYEKGAGLAGFLADKGVHGLFVAGTTGEGMLMTLDERKRLLETVVKAVGKRVDVIAHTGCLDTASTIELTCHAAQAGARAAGICTAQPASPAARPRIRAARIFRRPSRSRSDII